MQTQHIKVPVSRKITYSKSSSFASDVVYMKCGDRRDSNIKFITIDENVYRVIKSEDKSTEYCNPEYIITGSKTTTGYNFVAVTEYDTIPEALNITIVNIECDDLGYCVHEELLEFIKNKINFSNFVGKALFTNELTVYTVDGVNVTIECTNCDQREICEITSNTSIRVSDTLTSSKKVQNIIELGSTRIIDVRVNDFAENLDTKNTTYEQQLAEKLNILTSMFCKMSGTPTYENNNSKSRETQVVLKEGLIESFCKTLLEKKTRFKIGEKLKIFCNDHKFSVHIEGTNVKLQNVAFTITDPNVHVNIVANKSEHLFDTQYMLRNSDKLVFRIVSSNTKIIQKNDLICEIRSRLVNTNFIKKFTTDIYIGTNKVSLQLVDIFISSTDEIDHLENIVYTLRDDINVQITVDDNVEIETYIVDTEQKYEISSITLRLTKTYTSSSDIYGGKIREYFKYRVRNACVFNGRTFTHSESGIKYTVENVEFIDGPTDKNKVIGFFSERTFIQFNLEKIDSTVNFIDGISQSARNLDICTIKKVAKQMELDGLYGMTTHVEKFIKEVLLNRTNLVDKTLFDLITPTKGVILHGAPGTGKTTLARNIARLFGSTGSQVQKITATSLKSKWHGESENNIRNLFKNAIKEYESYGSNARLYILIIDEIDAILGARGDNDLHNSLVNQFLGEIDGLEQFDNCIIIGITNRLESLDTACLRPGRFGCHIHMDLPNESQRKIIFTSLHSQLEKAKVIEPIEQFDYERIAQITQGLSGADIKNIYQLALNEYVDKKLGDIDYIITSSVIDSILNSKYNI